MLLEFAEKVEPYPFGHGHPRFYGWVNGPPAPIGVFADALDEPRNVRAPVTKNVWFRAPPRTLFARADDRVAGGVAIAASPEGKLCVAGASVGAGEDAVGKRTGDRGLRLAEFVMSLSLATDLGMGQPMDWALRSCLLGVRLGGELGLDEGDLSDVYYLALLRYLGCTADSDRTAGVFGNDISALRRLSTGDSGYWVRSAGKRWVEEDSVGRCEVAENLAGRLGFGEGITSGLWQLFERWDGEGLPNRLGGEALAQPVRVVQLAQDAETFHRLGGVEAAIAVVGERSGGAYDPRVAERFCRAAPRLLASLDESSAWEAVLAAEPGPRPRLSEEAFDDAARAMADFADLKSPYLAGHSSGVAVLAAAAAERYGLPEGGVTDVRRAGWLHDLGRVGVSTAIWDKPGPLTEAERERVRLHPYFTERILARPGSLARIGAIAALHHERPDGTGYHRGLASSALPPTARVLAAADAYHAMTEPRPHRPALIPEAAAVELRREVEAGHVDGDAAEAVLAAAGHRTRPTRRGLPGGLSGREVEVLRLIARGLSNRQVAERLYISPKTVGHHVQHIYQKIGVSTRPAATVFAMQHDLLPGDAG